MISRSDSSHKVLTWVATSLVVAAVIAYRLLTKENSIPAQQPILVYVSVSLGFIYLGIICLISVLRVRKYLSQKEKELPQDVMQSPFEEPKDDSKTTNEFSARIHSPTGDESFQFTDQEIRDTESGIFLSSDSWEVGMNELAQTQVVTVLDDVYKTLDPRPLVGLEELRAFYRDELNQVRGGDRTRRLKLGLDRAFGRSFYKGILMGHAGVGKSTELSRLIHQVEDKFQVIRFSVCSDLDALNFAPLDVVLFMMAEIIDRTIRSQAEGKIERNLSETRLRWIWNWFSEEKYIFGEKALSGLEIESKEVDINSKDLRIKLLSLCARLKGELQFATSRDKEVEKYRLNRSDELLSWVNDLLDECGELLRETSNKEWLFVAEDFDKPGVSSDRVEKLFITYGSILRRLRAHLIFNVPLILGTQTAQLPFPQDQIMMLLGAPVYLPDRTVNQAGRAALKSVLSARMDPDLFERNQMDRLIVASGGNLRELFALTAYAADTALLREAKQIEAGDVQTAIYHFRNEYERRLGESPIDLQKIGSGAKLDRLIRIYNRNRKAQIPDEVLHALFLGNVVQEYDNEDRWLGVHPLVVDILASRGEIHRSAQGEVLGGLC